MNKFKQELEEIAVLARIVKKREQEIQAYIVFENIFLRDTEQFLRFAKQEGLSLCETKNRSGYSVSAKVKGQIFYVMFNKCDREYLLKEGLLP